MKGLKIAGIVLVCYAGLVVLFESSLGYFQPAGQGTLLITTTAADGTQHSRVVARLTSADQLYVAANHWPRDWYRQALAQPQVRATIDGDERTYMAVPVTGDEHSQVDADNSLGLVFRFLTGFPPRYFLRLDATGN